MNALFFEKEEMLKFVKGYRSRVPAAAGTEKVPQAGMIPQRSSRCFGCPGECPYCVYLELSVIVRFHV